MVRAYILICSFLASDRESTVKDLRRITHVQKVDLISGPTFDIIIQMFGPKDQIDEIFNSKILPMYSTKRAFLYFAVPENDIAQPPFRIVKKRRA